MPQDLTEFGENHRIVITPGAKDVVVCFSVVGTQPGKFVFSHVFEKHNSNQIYFRDPNNRWFLDGLPSLGIGIEGSIGPLLKLIGRLRGEGGRILFTGTSMGAFAALLYGSLCNADEIIAYSPEIILNIKGGHSLNFLKSKPQLIDLVGIVNASTSRVHLFYGEGHLADLMSAAHAARNLRNDRVRIQTFRQLKHIVSNYVDRRYRLVSVADAILRGDHFEFDASDLGNILQYIDVIEPCWRAELMLSEGQVREQLCEELEELSAAHRMAAYAFLPRSFLALCRAKLGQAGVACDHAHMAATQAPDLIWVLAALARVQLAAGRLIEGEKIVVEAVAISDFPAGMGDLNMHLEYSEYYKKKEMLGCALDQLGYVLKLSPNHQSALQEIQSVTQLMSKPS